MALDDELDAKVHRLAAFGGAASADEVGSPIDRIRAMGRGGASIFPLLGG